MDPTPGTNGQTYEPAEHQVPEWLRLPKGMMKEIDQEGGDS